MSTHHERLTEAAQSVPNVPTKETIRENWSVWRLGAIVGAGLLILSYTYILFDVVQVVGDPTTFYLIAIGSIVLATTLGPFLSTKQALYAGGTLFVGGLGYHGFTLGMGIDIVGIGNSFITLLTGTSVLWIPRADLWAMGFLPGPLFATWFLVWKREYSWAALVGGLTLGFFVLTGDASTTVTLLGVIGAGALLGFGDLETTAEGPGGPEHVAIVLALMVAGPFLITAVPGGASGPLTLVGGGEATPTMEENVLGSGEQLAITGAVDQDPEPRFLVRASEARYWRTGSYDRYTGDGWLQTAPDREYREDRVPNFDGHTRTFTQEIEVQSTIGNLPAAWQATEIDRSIRDIALVNEAGDINVEEPLQEGQTVTVVSEVPTPVGPLLGANRTDYPVNLEERYTQLPDTTSDRVEEFTEDIVADAESPYESAVRIENWLQANKDYSLDVDEPDGDIVEAFIFDMEEGYCTYYATAMVGMLRSVDIPARVAVGYTPGEQVGPNEWLVRGTNSHAWVEVYFPEVGWIEFDPTPAQPRIATEEEALVEARERGGDQVQVDIDIGTGAGVDRDQPDDDGFDEESNDSEFDGFDIDDRDQTSERRPEPGELDPGDDPVGPDSPSGTDEGENGDTDRDTPYGAAPDINETVDIGDPEATDDGMIPTMPRRHVALALVLLGGVVAGVKRSGVHRRVTAEVTIRYQRRHDPATDIERAYERLELILERRYRKRKPGETMRQYLDDIGATTQAHRIVRIREQSKYGGKAQEATADEAISLVDKIRRE